jgi:hypothetical protein
MAPLLLGPTRLELSEAAFERSSLLSPAWGHATNLLADQI